MIFLFCFLRLLAALGRAVVFSTLYFCAKFFYRGNYRRGFSVTKILTTAIFAIIFCILTVEFVSASVYDEVSLIREIDLNYCNDNSIAPDFDYSTETNSTEKISTEQVAADLEMFLAQSYRNRGGCLWSNLYYANTTLKPKNSGIKIKPDNFGIQVGVDVLTDHEVYSSFFANVNESKVKFSNLSKSTNDNFLFGYGKIYHWQVAHIGWGAYVGYDQYKISAAGESFSGNGFQSRLDGEIGLSFISKRWDVKPFYALQYNFLYHGNIESSNKNVIVSDWNGHGLTQFLGIRLNCKLFDNLLLLQSRATWVHELLDHPSPFYSSHFSSVKGKGASTPSVLFFDGNIGRDWAWVGFGLKWSFLPQRSLFLDYDAAINERRVTHLVNLGLCLGW
ncbi:MAG: autotransporter outer membrane beta-barrel domain-containing protein [Planctomycetaceae bacterium]|jgi:outer membrane autotransporter protein|nr:autotransporter outer membrane beta-barrel domain-containing protein [Planctomycetaceae bacterium]